MVYVYCGQHAWLSKMKNKRRKMGICVCMCVRTDVFHLHERNGPHVNVLHNSGLNYIL